jgi:hypothetical protein
MNTRPADNPEAYSTALTGRRWASAALYAALLLVALWTAREFVPAIAWAAVIAISVWPMLQWLEQRRPFRNRPVLLAPRASRKRIRRDNGLLGSCGPGFRFRI